VSGPVPAGRPRHRAADGRAPGAARKLAARTAAFLGSLPDRRLLDRIIRGRAWIPLLGVMLAGIVAMQVEQLKLGASIGRSIQRTTGLQSRNELLRTSVAALADDQRIERVAAGMGMVMPAPAAIGFLSVTPGADAAKAAASIHPPDSAGFLSLMSSNGAVVTGTGGGSGSSTSASDANGAAAASPSPTVTPQPTSTTAATAPAQSATSAPTQSSTSAPTQSGGSARGTASGPTQTGGAALGAGPAQAQNAPSSQTQSGARTQAVGG